MEPRARAGHRAAGQGLLGIRRARHRLRPAGRREPRRAGRDLSLDGADPVLPARRRALRPCGDRRCVPVAADHDPRVAVQPDEAEPGRRARPRPHHPRRDPGPRPRQARIPAGARRADPDDGPHLRSAAERDHRRQGHPLGEPWRRGRRHRRASPRRAPLRLHRARADGADRARCRPRGHDPRWRGGRDGHRGDRRGRRVASARANRPRNPRRAGSRADAPPAQRRRDAGDLPDLESPDEGAPRRGCGARDLPPIRRARGSTSPWRRTGRR